MPYSLSHIHSLHCVVSIIDSDYISLSSRALILTRKWLIRLEWWAFVDIVSYNNETALMKPQEICAYTFSFSETVNLKAQIESAKTFLRIHSIAVCFVDSCRRLSTLIYLNQSIDLCPIESLKICDRRFLSVGRPYRWSHGINRILILWSNRETTVNSA